MLPAVTISVRLNQSHHLLLFFLRFLIHLEVYTVPQPSQFNMGDALVDFPQITVSCSDSPDYEMFLMAAVVIIFKMDQPFFINALAMRYRAGAHTRHY